jgi:hypothetical protein
MSPGMLGPAASPAGPELCLARTPLILRNGAFTFAERPDLEAPDARIIWRSEFDPATLKVRAVPSTAGHPDAVDFASLAPWLTLVADRTGEHAVLSDGWRHIRLDVEEGRLAAGGPVILEYRLRGVASAEPMILPLRRLIDLCRRRQFSVSLYPPDPRVDRWLLALRVHDALTSGSSQREIASVLFGETGRGARAQGRSDSLRSRVRRLVTDARRLAQGGYRALMRRPR